MTSTHEIAAREIPPGKIMICDHPAPHEMAKKTVISRGTHKLWNTEVRLTLCSPGYVPAGSSCRWTNGYWAAHFEDDRGATYGRQYATDDDGEAEARANFARLTQQPTS